MYQIHYSCDLIVTSDELDSLIFRLNLLSEVLSFREWRIRRGFSPIGYEQVPTHYAFDVVVDYSDEAYRRLSDDGDKQDEFLDLLPGLILTTECVVRKNSRSTFSSQN